MLSVNTMQDILILDVAFREGKKFDKASELIEKASQVREVLDNLDVKARLLKSVSIE